MNKNIQIIIQTNLNEKVKEKLSKKLKNYKFEKITPVTKTLFKKKDGPRTLIKSISEEKFSELTESKKTYFL
jgi:hypothetical protein